VRPVGQLQHEPVGFRIVVRPDLHEPAVPEQAELPSGLVEQKEAAIRGHAGGLELDLAGVDEREALDRRDRQPGDAGHPEAA
jgi:hypothetical protein